MKVDMFITFFIFAMQTSRFSIQKENQKHEMQHEKKNKQNKEAVHEESGQINVIEMNLSKSCQANQAVRINRGEF